ncbi:unnamed protein product [Danaus chrysippus]|uniref:(African queen) hypothetical protein n=1 Tax=Danaus chrysippus TaxID=151541 RepID=A0A8J2R7F6_9NEOP|nr:unnamed protein product [Danaus chrysippus]
MWEDVSKFARGGHDTPRVLVSYFCGGYFIIKRSWEQEQARVAALLEEIISDNEDNVAVESDASLDEDFIQESDHDSLSKWHRVKGRTAIRTRAHNIITEAPLPKGHLDRRFSQPGLPKALKRMLNATGSSTEGMSPKKSSAV